MSIRQTAIALTLALAASTAAFAQNVVRNSGFTPSAPRTGDGSIPPNQVAPWTAAYGTPQLIAGEGCHDAGYIALWGTRTAGEAIMQEVALKKGVSYEVSLCARYRTSPVPAALVMRASTAPLRDPSCPAPGCEALPGVKSLTSTAWTPYTFHFTPSSDFTYLTLSASNDAAGGGDANVSWIEFDDVSIVPSISKAAPIYDKSGRDAIPDQFIVVFKRGATAAQISAAEDTVTKMGGKILARFTKAIVGFSVKAPLDRAPRIREAVSTLPGVAWIEVDGVVRPSTIQNGPPAGLDRIDRRLLPLDSRYTYSETGATVHAYVIDSGIRTTHVEFGGRATGVFTAFSDGLGTSDTCGHGTHVAGTIGGTTYGVAKNVALHAVRVLTLNSGQCTGSITDVVNGVDWVTNNRINPAVANMSLGGGASITLDTAVANSVASGVTYAVAAGNWNDDACLYSPARTPSAITVGATDPATDVRASFSNYGTCLDLFAPGVGIVSASNASDTATATMSGTSMATPHVAGVAARHLQFFPNDSPAQVWAAIHHADDVSTTPNWPGVSNPGPGSPNELLHWGSLNDGYNDGDPHITTVDGAHYNFQAAGEFVYLRDADMEIQTRQTPVATSFSPGADPYDGLATCVSLNTAVAARVGSNRVTYQPGSNGMELRIDGVVTALSAQGINLSGGGRVTPPPTGSGVEIIFPDQTILTAINGAWINNTAYLNVDVTHTRASEGIVGAMAPGSWLPALPGGQSVGPMPAQLHDRFVKLNQTFADAWRVTGTTSLFDYAAGTSTATFTLKSWPPESGPCVIPKAPVVNPVDRAVALQACAKVGESLKGNCVYDVMVTGQTNFAQAYEATQAIVAGGTSVTVRDDRDPSIYGMPVTFTATVVPRSTSQRGVPAGTVQFVVDGTRTGNPVPLDANGRASYRTTALSIGKHLVSAIYLPARGSAFLGSSSLNEPHGVTRFDVNPEFQEINVNAVP